MSKRVFVTGVGIISAMGVGVESNLAFAKEGKSPIAAPRILKTLQSQHFPLAEVGISNQELLDMLKIRSKRIFSRTSLLAMVAAKEALENAEIVPDDKTGYISGTSVGGMDQGEYLYNGLIRREGAYDIHQALVHDCGESTQTVLEYLKIPTTPITISTACSSAANAIMHGARLIKSGKFNRALAGGTDALTRFTLNGFRSLMILSDMRCTPFDKDRKGLNLGEGAGYVVLESEEVLEREGRAPLCELTGYANSCDAYHQTASSPNGYGAGLAISGALQLAGISPADISYINAHGTATPNNDLSEGIAMKRIFGERLPFFSSTKALTGHTLGASGGIEAVLSTMAIQKGIVYPNLHFKTPIEEVGNAPVTTWQEADVQHVLSNSFGFGGNNTSLVFSKVERFG